MEMLLTIVACSGMFVAIGFMNRGRESPPRCAGCDGTCLHESECQTSISETQDHA